MAKYLRLAYMVLAGIVLVPQGALCKSLVFVPPYANVVHTGKAVVVAYDTKYGVQVEARDAEDGKLSWSRFIPSARLARSACAARGSVFVATQDEGIHVLSADTGMPKAQLKPHSPLSGDPLLGCVGNRVFVAYDGQNWLIAYDAERLQPVWRRSVDGIIFELWATGAKVTLLQVSQLGAEDWKQVVYRVDNGQLAATQPSASPTEVVPPYVPRAVRKWYEKTVGSRSVTEGPTTFEQRGKLWFITTPSPHSMIYAVSDRESVVWATAAQGLSSVALAGDRLIAATTRDWEDWDKDTKYGYGKLFALDAKTGRQLWVVSFLP